MKITFLAIGKTAERYLQEGIAVYEKRLKFYTRFEIELLPDVKHAAGMSREQLAEKEGALFLKRIREQDLLVLLDEKGKEYSSTELAGQLEKWMQLSRGIVMVAGGAYGFSRDMYNRADHLLSLSRMTFSHQMVRLLFAEQLYRAFTIIKGEPYHHE